VRGSLTPLCIPQVTVVDARAGENLLVYKDDPSQGVGKRAEYPFAAWARWWTPGPPPPPPVSFPEGSLACRIKNSDVWIEKRKEAGGRKTVAATDT